MPRLVLLNGAPGSGKTTLARRLAEDHPLTLVLDVDRVRGMLGRWLDAPAEAGRRARAMALAMARVHLQAGHDVVVPQFLGVVDFVLALEDLCSEVGATFTEVALLSSPEEAVVRFARRSATSRSAQDRDNAELQARGGGDEGVAALYGRLLDVVAVRPRTHTVTTVDGHEDEAYADLLAVLAAAAHDDRGPMGDPA